MPPSAERKRRRALGEHLTPSQIFETYIAPELLPVLHAYRFVDLFAGRGHLIFPLVEQVPPNQRADFFREHILMYDVQQEMVEFCVRRAVALGIPEPLARQNIRQQDTLAHYPEAVAHSTLPVYHVTNPPYLYLGYIPKQSETQAYLRYFEGCNEGYQDLYQIALINDLRHGIPRMVYIIPSNFLFGNAISNKIRSDLLPFYRVSKAILFEREMFEFTGVHVALCFFERKSVPAHEEQIFTGLKINRQVHTRTYRLTPSNHYRAGGEFEMFVRASRALHPLKVRFYLMLDTICQHPGEHPITLIDANAHNGKCYQRRQFFVSDTLADTIRANPLFVRTLDTGSADGRAGLYLIPEVFGADGIIVTQATYRTHPIQIFLEPTLSQEDLSLLRDYFNLMLEHFREQTDSEFLTTYKYSNSAYTRKYLGLSQAKALIETFPCLEWTPSQRTLLETCIARKDAEGVIAVLNQIREGGQPLRLRRERNFKRSAKLILAL
ncbi:MAG: N-6 DNA methylase [Fimbriimonadales bacterium]